MPQQSESTECSLPADGHCQSILRRQWVLLLPPSISGYVLRDMRATRGTPSNVEEQRNKSLFFLPATGIEPGPYEE